MDIYFEQNVENSKIDASKKKFKILTIVRYVLLSAAIIVGYLMIMNVMMTPFNNGVTAILIQSAIGIFAVSPFVLSFIFLGRYLNNTNLEYDYILSDGLFRIVKVINRKKRRKLVEFNLSNIESIGKLQSESYDRYSSSKEVKKIFAICDYDNEENVVYIYYNRDGIRYLLHIEPNDEMITSLRRCVSRISIMDKSMKTNNPIQNTLDKGATK